MDCIFFLDHFLGQFLDHYLEIFIRGGGSTPLVLRKR